MSNWLFLEEFLEIQLINVWVSIYSQDRCYAIKSTGNKGLMRYVLFLKSIRNFNVHLVFLIHLVTLFLSPEITFINDAKLFNVLPLTYHNILINASTLLCSHSIHYISERGTQFKIPF